MRPHLGLVALALGCVHPDQPLDSKESAAPDSIDTGVDSPDPETATETGTDTGEPPDTQDTGETDSPADSDTGDAPPPCDRSRPWVFVDAGVEQTCGIHDDGCAECWGIGEEDNSSNGDSGGYHWQGEDQPPAESFVMLDLLKDPDDGWFPHTCGILADGSATCWGECSLGQCDVPSGTYTDVAVTTSTTWGVLDDGTATLWGSRVDDPGLSGIASVQAGIFVLVTDTTGLQSAWGEAGSVSTHELPEGTFIAGDVGHFDACALQTDGTPLCWLRDEPENWATCNQTLEAPPGPFTEICVGSRSIAACALDTAGKVTCWGDDSMPGSLKDYPTDVTFTQIACGYAHACGVTTDGGTECWGYDRHGETVVPT